MKSNKHFIWLGMMAGSLLFTGALFAKDKCCNAAGDLDKSMQKMTQKLDLTAEQQTQIKKIKEDCATEKKASWQKYDDQILAVLSDGQKEKYKAMQEKMSKGKKMKGKACPFSK